MLFENKTTLNLEDFILLQTTWETRKSPLRRLKGMQRLCFALPGIILTLVGGQRLWALLPGFTASRLPMALLWGLLLALGLALIFRPSGSGLARRNWRRYREKGEAIRYTFGEDRFAQESGGRRYEMGYDVLRDLMEDDRVFLLFFSDFGAHVLHKDSFTAGDAAGFRTFLIERTGLSFQRL